MGSNNIKRTLLFVAPMSVLWSIAVWVGTLNPEYGWKGSIATGAVYGVVYLMAAFIVGQQQNNGGAFPSQ